jgi:hypothetical protein
MSSQKVTLFVGFFYIFLYFLPILHLIKSSSPVAVPAIASHHGVATAVASITHHRVTAAVAPIAAAHSAAVHHLAKFLFLLN